MDLTIVYILIAVGVGWFIGFLDSNLRTAKKIRAAEFNAELKIEEAEKKAAQAEKKFLEANPLQDDPGLLRLKKTNGRHTLELDGFLAPDELTLDMRKRLIELITVFRLWLEPGPSSSPVSQPVTPTQPSRPAVPDPIREAVYGSPQPDPIREAYGSAQPDPIREAMYGSTQTSPVQDEEISRPVKTSTQPAPKVKKPEADKDIKSLSIVQQIDMVLQEQLLYSPLAGRGVRLQESIRGGVEVYVGLKKYETVDDVPDEDIKGAIRSAIAAWEKKYTPGM